MGLTYETAIVVSSVIGSVIYCSGKICKQIQHSKCTTIKLCCCYLERTVNDDPDDEVDVESPSTIIASISTPEIKI